MPSASSRRSSASPDSTIRPRRRTCTRSAIASAWRTCCSTRITATPWSAAARTAASSRSTTMGASPRDSSSASSTRGSAASTRPRASICCWPPDSSPTRLPRCSSSSGKNSSAFSGRPRPSLRFCQPVSCMNTQRSSVRMPRPGSGALVQPTPPVVAVEGDGPGDRRDLTGEREERRRLAGAVGAQQGHHLAGPGLEVDVVDGGRAAVPGGQPAGLDDDVAPTPGRRRPGVSVIVIVGVRTRGPAPAACPCSPCRPGRASRPRSRRSARSS